MRQNSISEIVDGEDFCRIVLDATRERAHFCGPLAIADVQLT